MDNQIYLKKQTKQTNIEIGTGAMAPGFRALTALWRETGSSPVETPLLEDPIPLLASVDTAHTHRLDVQADTTPVHI